ncbi:hypothetical protein MRX96_033597 [Rhipicephalus microplus]
MGTGVGTRGVAVIAGRLGPIACGVRHCVHPPEARDEHRVSQSEFAAFVLELDAAEDISASGISHERACSGCNEAGRQLRNAAHNQRVRKGVSTVSG